MSDDPFDTRRPRVTPGRGDAGDAPIPDLVRRALDEARALAGAEWRLARAEMVEGAAASARALGMLAGALVLGLAAAVMVLVALMAALVGMGVWPWLAALLAALIGLAAAAGLAKGARNAGGPVLPRTRGQWRADKRELAAAIEPRGDRTPSHSKHDGAATRVPAARPLDTPHKETPA